MSKLFVFLIQSVKNLLTEDAIDLKENAIAVTEFDQKGLSFAIPLKLQIKQNILISGKVIIDSVSTEIHFICKVLAIIKENDVQRIEVELIQYNKTLWQKFILESQKRQRIADKILDSMKGEDVE